ncbi:MAG TPA: hypothetical protein VGD59_03135 [Acidisarcina sp.]
MATNPAPQPRRAAGVDAQRGGGDLRPTPEGEELFRRWLKYLDDEITKHRKPTLRAELVRDSLHQLYLGRPHGGKLNMTLSSELSANVLQLSLDSANVILEAEADPGVDVDMYAERKPLIYFWLMFDRSPVALNQWLGCRFRAMLGKHIFKSIGKRVRIFRGVELYYGYNVNIEDETTIGQYVTMDDREEITIPKGAIVPPYTVINKDWKQPR